MPAGKYNDAMSPAMKLGSIMTVLLAAAARAQTFSSEDVAFFEAKIRPLLASQCLGCHSNSRKSPPANLALDSRAAILKGGDSGPAAIAGDPGSSRILQALRYQGPQMPPSGKLPGEQIALIEQWIAKGLPWPAEPAAATAPADTTKARAAKRWAWEPLHP